MRHDLTSRLRMFNTWGDLTDPARRVELGALLDEAAEAIEDEADATSAELVEGPPRELDGLQVAAALARVETTRADDDPPAIHVETDADVGRHVVRVDGLDQRLRFRERIDANDCRRFLTAALADYRERVLWGFGELLDRVRRGGYEGEG